MQQFQVCGPYIWLKINVDSSVRLYKEHRYKLSLSAILYVLQ